MPQLSNAESNIIQKISAQRHKLPQAGYANPIVFVSFKNTTAEQSYEKLEFLTSSLKLENEYLPRFFSQLYQLNNEEINIMRQEELKKSVEELQQIIEIQENLLSQLEEVKTTAQLEKFWTALKLNMELHIEFLEIFAYPQQEDSEEADAFWVGQMGKAIENGDIEPLTY